jgi:hypothetical protein
MGILCNQHHLITCIAALLAASYIIGIIELGAQGTNLGAAGTGNAFWLLLATPEVKLTLAALAGFACGAFVYAGTSSI